MGVTQQQKLMILIPISVLSTVCLCIATSTHQWSTFNDKKLKLTASYGLWKSCVLHNRVHVCYDTDDMLSFTSHNNVCRILSIIACILSFGVIVMTLLTMVTEKVSGYTVGIKALAATIFMTYSLALYSARHKAMDPHAHVFSHISFGWSYIMAWVGVLLGILTSIIAFFV